MPVTTIHNDYEKQKTKWKRCRHAVEGSDAIKDEAATYLPVPSGMTASNPKYMSYKTRSKWFPATSRTLEGLEGEVFRNPPRIDDADALEDALKDVTLTGQTFNQYARQALQHRLVAGRFGTLVEWSDKLQRPYLIGYTAENIINWRSITTGEGQKLTMVVLQELVGQEPEDEFDTQQIVQLRALTIDQASGVYVSRIYQTKELMVDGTKSVEPTLVSESVPTMRGEALTKIPFIFHGVSENSSAIEKPPMLDLVDLNIADFRNSADLEHGRHFCGLPFYYIFGATELEDDEAELEIGSSAAFTSSNADCKAGIIEFSGQGLGALEKAREENRTEMALMGARLMEEAKKTGETAEALARRQSGKLSVLQAMVEVQNEAHEDELNTMLMWLGQTDADATVHLNKDFTVSKLEPQDLQALVASWQAGAISSRTLFENLQNGEIISQDRGYEEEQALIDEEAPVMEPSLGLAG